MKTTLKTAAAGVELEAVDGQLHLTVSRVLKGQGDRPDRLHCIALVLTTEEAARFADTFVGMACIAEEQLYHRDVDRAFSALGLPVPARDLAIAAANSADARQAGDVLIPAYFGEFRQ